MALVSKRSQTIIISNFWSICLVTSLYKIIDKVISSRIRRVIHETIRISQGTFVEGKQSLNIILIANEVVDEKRRSR